MDFSEKARIRIEHWIKHNEDHLNEYEKFAKELDRAEKKETVDHIRNMATLVAQGNKSLKLALETLAVDK